MSYEIQAEDSTQASSADPATTTPRVPGEPPMLSLQTCTPAVIAMIANRWSRGTSRVFLESSGVGIEGWRIMVLLAIEGPLTAHRLAKSIFMDKASVSRNLKSLSLAGLITLTPDTEDARQRFAELTQKGFAVHDQLFWIAIARSDRMLSCLDPTERATFMTLLTRVRENLSALDEDDVDDPQHQVRTVEDRCERRG